MSDKIISSIHIQKLGHNIPEIRERALDNIITKLENGYIFDNDLSRTKELLSKLFDWFLFQPCSKEKEVLHFIKTVLQMDSGRDLLKHYGYNVVVSKMKDIRTYVEPKFFTEVDDIIEYLNCTEKQQLQQSVKDVPPLVSDLPLSHRTIQTIHSNEEAFSVIGTTASTIRGFVHQDTSQDECSGRPHSTAVNSYTHCSETDSYFCYNYFNWQILVAPDHHVLESIEDSLKNPPEPSALINSCEFFAEVILQDFPAEIFLQRTSIINLIFDLLDRSTSARLNCALLICINKLSKALIKRIHFYSDPCTYSSKKQLPSPCSSSRSTSTKDSTFSNREYDDDKYYEDSAILMTKQISLPTYCMRALINILQFMCVKPKHKNKHKYQICYNVAMEAVDSTIYLLGCCVKKDLLCDENKIDVRQLFTKVLIQFGNALEYFRLEVMANDYEKSSRLIQLNLIHNTLSLIKKTMTMAQSERILPKNLKNAITNFIFDSTFMKLYSSTYEEIYEIIKSFESGNESSALKKHENIANVCYSISAAVKLIKQGFNMPTLEAIKLTVEGIYSLEFHKNLDFVKVFIEICANKLPFHSSNERILKSVESVVLSLLAHEDLEIKKYTYKECRRRIIAAIGPKLNLNKTGNISTQIQFLLRYEILLEIIIHGLMSGEEDVKECSEDIIIHLLKCKILVPDNLWNIIVENLIQLLPILAAFVNKGSVLGRAIINIFDPDVGEKLHFPKTDIFKANIALLFVNDNLIREEAISRISWLLSTQNSSGSPLPRINSLSDKALSTICLIKNPYDLNKSHTVQKFYQPSHLKQILELLDSCNVEPIVRRSAITQLAVMMEDVLLHTTFIQNRGIEIIQNSMHMAVNEDDYREYPDSLISSISVLKNLCLYNANARHEIAQNSDICNYTVRGMFLYCAENKVREDASVLLFLILFGNLIFGSPSKGELSIPNILQRKLNAPFISNVHWCSSKNTLESLKVVLSQNKWALSYLQIHFNAEVFGGVETLLECEESKSVRELGFDGILQMGSLDLLLLKHSDLEYCLKEQLKAIENSTSYEVIENSINFIMSYVQLYMIANDNFKNNFDLLSIDWKEFFKRFLISVPCGEEDVFLLTAVVKLMNKLLPLTKISTAKDNWLLEILKNPSCLLYVQLRSDVTSTETKILNREILLLITECTTIEQNYLQFHDVGAKDLNTSWAFVIDFIANSLQFSDTQHFYNLAYLDCLLTGLLHLTSILGWSKSKSGENPKPILKQLVNRLCDLVGAFHCSKGPTASVTFMGISVTRNVLLILNHVLAEMQYIGVRAWESCFLEEDINGKSYISNLYAVWLSRDVILKAGVFQLFAGLAMSMRTSTLLVQEFLDNNTDILEITINILLDPEEASIVKENVALFLSNLLSHSTIIEDASSIMINFGQKIDDSVEAILYLLNQKQFFKELQFIFANIFLQNNIYNSTTEGKCKLSNNYNTPGFIKSLMKLLNNLIILEGRHVTSLLQENKLIKLIFRSLVKVPIKINNTRDISLYCDILEMNTYICRLLSKIAKVDYLAMGIVLHLKDSLVTILSLLDPTLYYDSLSQLIYLRNKLWIEIFSFLTILINKSCFKDKAEMNAKDIHSLIMSILHEKKRHQVFLQTVYESLYSTLTSDLQNSALIFLEILFKTYDSEIEDSKMSPDSFLDQINSPRVDYKLNTLLDENEEDGSIDTMSRSALTNIYQKSGKLLNENNVTLKAGAELCKILLHLCNSVVYSRNSNKKKRNLVFSAISSIICVSYEAKEYALEHGLMELIIEQLKQIYTKLSLESIDCLKRISDKKRVCPVLKDLSDIIGLTTNFLVNNAVAKDKASCLGLADVIHKLWIWISMQKPLLLITLKMLCTYTTNSVSASQSLVLTSPVAGTGPRKLPGNIALIHSVIKLISKEMDQISKAHDLTLLKLAFHLLENTCSSIECRITIGKSNLFQNVNRMHPAITKKQKPWETIEFFWLSFLQYFTSFSEGQATSTKIPDLMELIITLANSTRKENRISAMDVLKNIAFYQPNRTKLLMSEEFLNVLVTKMTNGCLEEKNLTVIIMWALTANNQKAKLIFKCIGLDMKLKETLKNLQVSQEVISNEDFRRMHYVLDILNVNDKT